MSQNSQAPQLILDSNVLQTVSQLPERLSREQVTGLFHQIQEAQLHSPLTLKTDPAVLSLIDRDSSKVPQTHPDGEGMPTAGEARPQALERE